MGKVIEKAEEIIAKKDGLYLKDIVTGKTRTWEEMENEM